MFRVGCGLFSAAYRPQYKWSCWETWDKQSGTRRSFTNLFTLFCSLPMWLMWVKTKTNASWCWIQPSFVRLQSVTSWSQSIPFGMKQTISRGAVFGGEALTVAGVENQKTYVSTVALWCKCLFYRVDFFFPFPFQRRVPFLPAGTVHNTTQWTMLQSGSFWYIAFLLFSLLVPHLLFLLLSFILVVLYSRKRERERELFVLQTPI